MFRQCVKPLCYKRNVLSIRPCAEERLHAVLCSFGLLEFCGTFCLAKRRTCGPVPVADL